MSKSQYRSFFLAATDDGSVSESLNRFLRSHVVLSVEREYVASPAPGWAFCIVYELPKSTDPAVAANTVKPRTDYRARLSSGHQLVFDRMRDVRTELAEAEGKKRYNILTDAQLFAVLEQNVTTLAEFKTATKMSDERVSQYAESFLVVLREQAESADSAGTSQDLNPAK